MSANTLFGILGLLAGAGVLLAFITAQIQLRINKERNFLVSLIFVAIALRLAKSIVFFLLSDIAPIGLALGFLGLSSIGPLLWIYFKGELDIKRSFKQNWKHFIYPILGFVVCLVWYNLGIEGLLYQIATLVLAGYIVFSWRRYLKSKVSVARPIQDRALLILVTRVMLAFVYQHLTNTMLDYALGSGICAMFIYAYFTSQLLIRKPKNQSLQVQLPDNIKLKIKDALERDLLFLNSGITLSTFSRELNVPSYLISKTVKELYQKSFPDTISYFRIKQVKAALERPENAHLKIESLAYDAGFSTPSAFYYAFKKQTGQTPTSYQQELALKSA